MSITPIDGSESRTGTGGGDDEKKDADGLVGHAIRRVRTALRRGVSAVRRLIEAEPSRDSQARVDDGESRTSADLRHPLDPGGSAASRLESGDTTSPKPLERGDSVTTALPDQETEGLPARDQPFTQPARSTGDENPPQLVGNVDDDELTVELPGKPDATIKSDVWERAEP